MSINVLLLSFQSFDVDVGLVMRTCYALCLVDLSYVVLMWIPLKFAFPSFFTTITSGLLLVM